MTTTMDIRRAAGKADAGRAKAYRDMIARRARGEEVAPEKCLAVIEAAGVTPEEWDADLGRLTERFERLAAIKDGDRHRREAERVAGEVAKADRVLELAQQRRDAAVDALERQAEAARLGSIAAEDAPGKLINSSSPALQEAILRLRDRESRAAGQARELRNKAEGARYRAKRDQERAGAERKGRNPFRARGAGEQEPADQGGAEAEARDLDRRADVAEAEAKKLAAETGRLESIAQDPVLGLWWEPSQETR